MPQALVASPAVDTLLGFVGTTHAELQSKAIQQLTALATTQWAEISEALPYLEQLYEEQKIVIPEAAALLISILYFSLEQYTETLKFALLAGSNFHAVFVKHFQYSGQQRQDDSPDGDKTKLYVELVIALAIDEYIRINSAQTENESSGLLRTTSLSAEATALVDVPSHKSLEHFAAVRSLSKDQTVPGASTIDSVLLEQFVEQLIYEEDTTENLPQVLQDDQLLKLLLGVSIEAANIEHVEKLLHLSPSNLGAYLVRNCDALLPSKKFRNKVLTLVARDFRTSLSPLLKGNASSGARLDDAVYLLEAYFLLNNPDGIAELFADILCLGDNQSTVDASMQELFFLHALQLGFDLTAFESRSFTNKVLTHPRLRQPAPSPVAPTEDASIANASETTPLLASSAQSSSQAPADPSSKNTDGGWELSADPLTRKISALQYVLKGRLQVALYLKFSHMRNETDLKMLETLKGKIDTRSAVAHTTLITAHGLMQRGTGTDVFLRKNIDWFAPCTCWAKFSATASIGVIHQGNITKSFQVLASYLPGTHPGSSISSNPASRNSYADGGALFGLGLLHAGCPDPVVTNYFLSQLSASVPTGTDSEGSMINEIVQHGCSLGLGFTCLGTADSALTNPIWSILLNDSAISGEAAALGTGLVMMGSNDQRIIDELYTYAHETRHERIIRACGLATALMLYRAEGEGTAKAMEMINDPDALLRYGGCFALGMTWCGTANDFALRSLLHVAVSDSSDETRRGAVIALAFVLCNVPEQGPRVFSLLTQSFNFHVRFAAALAVGITCAATASMDALNLLLPLLTDSADVVRQAALIAIGFVMMACPEKQAPVFPSAMKKAAQAAEAAAKLAEEIAAAKEAEEKQSGDKKTKPKTETPPVVGKKTKKEPTPTELVIDGDCRPSVMREMFMHVASDKREDIMARIGAILGLGIMEAGGRNVVCSFVSSRGLLRPEAVAGFVLFTQFWNWYPLIHCISLTMTPACLIGIEGGLRVPQGYSVECLAPPSQFAYPERIVTKVEKVQIKTVSAVLSVQKPKKEETTETSPAPSPAPEPEVVVQEDVVMEPQTTIVNNFTRVLKMQEPLIRSLKGSRYETIRKKLRSGIVVLRDTQPNAPETYMEIYSKPPAAAQPAVSAPEASNPLEPVAVTPAAAADPDEPECPPAFEWAEDGME